MKKNTGIVLILLGLGLWVSMYWIYPLALNEGGHGFFWFLNALFGSVGALGLVFAGVYHLDSR